VAAGGRLAALDEIPDGEARGFTVAADAGVVSIFVVRRGAWVYAYENSCPHVGTPLDWTPDDFLDREKRHVVCATHGAIFRVEDGVCLAGPCQGDQLEPWPVAVRDGEVWDASATLAANEPNSRRDDGNPDR
jgi:nitrite reductase/ring-hydroxylating ferredoxin subunit